MEMESVKEPVLSVYPPMRWVKYGNGVMILQVLTVVGDGKSAWLNVPTVDASSVYLEKSESVRKTESESVKESVNLSEKSDSVVEKNKSKNFWGRKK